jgi:membrane associated rhomboid family serine protease
MERYLFDAQAVLIKKEYYRLITSGFLHANWVHFGINCYSLFSFGCAVENEFGLPLLSLIFIPSVIGGNLVALFFHRNHDYRALGASGGVCGVIFASIFLFPGSSVGLFPIPISIPAPLYAILFIFSSVYGIRTARDNIGHDAHLGGALVGLFVTAIFNPWVILGQPILFVIVVLLSFILIYLLIKMPLLSFFDIKAMFNKIKSAHEKKRTKSTAIDRKKKEDAVDDILEKISLNGINSLTNNEINILKKRSEK